MPYAPPYAPPNIHNSGSGTAVPDTWTAMAPPLEDEEASVRNHGQRRKNKGKHKA